MYLCKDMSLLTGGSLTRKTVSGARTGIGRFVKRVTGAFQTSSNPGRAPYRVRMIAVEIV